MKIIMNDVFEEKITGVVVQTEENSTKIIARPKIEEFKVIIKDQGWPVLLVKQKINSKDIYTHLDLYSLLDFIEAFKRETLWKE